MNVAEQTQGYRISCVDKTECDQALLVPCSSSWSFFVYWSFDPETEIKRNESLEVLVTQKRIQARSLSKKELFQKHWINEGETHDEKKDYLSVALTSTTTSFPRNWSLYLHELQKKYFREKSKSNLENLRDLESWLWFDWGLLKQFCGSGLRIEKTSIKTSVIHNRCFPTTD